MSEEASSTEGTKDPFEKEQEEIQTLIEDAPSDFFRRQRMAASEGKTTRYAWVALAIVLLARMTHQMQ
jgi:hypothetical protein